MLFAKMRSAGFGSDSGIAGSPGVRQWPSRMSFGCFFLPAKAPRDVPEDGGAGNSQSAENHAKSHGKNIFFFSEIPKEIHSMARSWFGAVDSETPWWFWVSPSRYG